MNGADGSTSSLDATTPWSWDGASAPDAPHTVTACPTLPSATGPVWDNLTSNVTSIANVDFRSILIDPSNTATVYLGTANHGIFKTLDCGATWAKINTGTNGDIIDNGIPWSMAIDRQNTQVIWANAGFSYGHNAANTNKVPGTVFKSLNGGVDWAEMMPAGFGDISSLTLDRADSQHVVVSFHGSCHTPTSPYANCLAESFDGGANWSYVPAPQAWTEGDGQCLMDRTHWLFAAPLSGGIWYTSNSGTNWAQVSTVRSGAGCFLSTSGVWYLGGPVGIHASTDAQTWTQVGPGCYGFTGHGATLWESNNGPPYETATEPVTTKSWTTITAPSNITAPNGARISYDVDHHLLYSSNHTGGFWRARLP
jgi:hypothetical protein